MNERRAAMRLEVAQGHWGLGEFEEALDSLSRGLDEAPGYLPIIEFIETIEGQPPELALARKLAALRARVAPAAAAKAEREAEAMPPLQSSTLAELLAEQGHDRKALRVVEEVLRRNPGDERARAMRERLSPSSRERERWIGELERWLAAAKALRRQREAHG
jgi:hypothetical protein